MRINPAKLLPGDIILTNEKRFVSGAIRLFTRGSYSHAMMYLGHCSYIEAIGLGVHTRNLLRFTFANQNNCCILRLKDHSANKSQIQMAIMYARSKHGYAYSVLDALKSGAIALTDAVLPFNIRSDKQFCSRLVAEAYHFAGIELCSISPQYVRPVDLQKSQIIRRIDDCYIPDDKAMISENVDVNLIEEQDKAVNKMMRPIWKVLRKNGVTIGGVSEIIPGLMRVPEDRRAEVDIIVADAINKSGYLNLWKREKELNPAGHDVRKFIELHGISDETREIGLGHYRFSYDAADRSYENLKAIELMCPSNRYVTVNLLRELEQNIRDVALKRRNQFAIFHITKDE